MIAFLPGARTIAVISDSHRDRRMLERAAQAIRGANADAVIHLGDVAADAAYIARLVRVPLLCVRGNCDFPGSAPEEVSGLLGGRMDAPFLACHGHRYEVKGSPLSLLYRCREIRARIALYGHTHIAFSAMEDGVLLLNPGALRDGRYALLRLNDGGARAELLRVDDDDDQT